MLTDVLDRGEGANHGITDISLLLDKILPSIQSTSAALPEESTATVALQDAINNYEQEMIERAGSAVLTSRRACLDAHDYKKITDQSPLVSRRVMVTEE
jgi:prophage antirepressor-like protein